MKLFVLTENMAGDKFLAEHGLSYLIEHEEQTILFDTGHSDVFLKNAKMMGIDISRNINTVVLSHGHWDHGDGLGYLENKTLITHPVSFIRRFRKNNDSNIGLARSKREIEKRFKLITSSKPYKISPNIIYLGEIPRENDYEAQTTTFIDENGNDDFIPDDSALAIINNNELIIISGCAHSGICNISEYAKKVTGLEKIKTVIGGFHLKYDDLQTRKTIKYFKRQKIKQIYPSHCTELPALAMFYNEFKTRQVKSGMILNI
jgi:7,8-dihydropterin-6-yl-methyl-4-(beta-D-ribofuranosyl)aminobenzene 5'-phosphate synthase